MSSDIPARTSPSIGSSFRLRRLLQKWPLLVWLGAFAGLLYMFAQRGNYGRVNGMVFANIEDIAPPAEGYINAVHVREGEQIKKDQLLVTLDPTLLEREIESMEQQLILDRLRRANAFQSELTKVEDSLNRVEDDQKQDEALSKVAEQKVLAVKSEVELGTKLPQYLRAAEIEFDAVETRLEGYSKRIEGLTKNKNAAAQLVRDLAAAEKAENEGEEPKALKVLKEQLANKILLAPSNGTIQKVHKFRGVVQLGEPILTFIPDVDEGTRPAKMVRGFVQQKEDPEALAAGSMIWVSQREKNPVAYPTKIISVAPDITAIQNYGTPVPGQFFRGREFLCELPAELGELLPGTAVHIHRKEPGKFDIWNFGKTPVRAAAK